MYRLDGELINVFRQPASEKFPESYKVQILGETTTPAGETRKEMLTLSASFEQWEFLKSRLGRPVSVPVGLFVRGRALCAYIPKDASMASMAAPPAPVRQGAAAT